MGTVQCGYCALVVAAVLGYSSGYVYETRYFTTKVDHFGYANNDTFKMRYLIASQHWNGTDSPIFFYTGNEGDIDGFAQNTGLMWEWAPEFGALLVFAEHRYYGKSMPYGNESYQSPEHLGYLTAEQALADYADLLQYLKATLPGARNSPVVSFGGSYGGMVAAWFRIKYPHITVAALAASAPVLQFRGLTPCSVYNQIVTKAYHKASPNCSAAIRKSWDVMSAMASTEEGARKVGETFKLCHPLSPSNYTALQAWLYDVYGNLAMMNYPYPSDFLMPVPGYPVEEACKCLDGDFPDNESLLEGVYEAVSVYSNYTGSADCNDVSGHSDDRHGMDNGWAFQACTEMVMPMCSDGVSDMFYVSPWNLTAYVEACRNRYGVSADPDKIVTTYGGKNIRAASNIIFSNGDMDPWSGGGFLESVSDSVIALVVEGGAHHYDLRASNPADTDSVLFTRALEKKYIRRWLDEAAGKERPR